MHAFYSVRNGTWEMNEMQHNQQGKIIFTNFTISEGAWTLSEKVCAKIIDNDYPQKVLSMVPWRKNDEENKAFVVFLKVLSSGNWGGSKLVSIEPQWKSGLPASVVYHAPRDTITRGA